MKRLTRNLIASSIDAYVLALETINRPSISYRMEAFCFLICNAWELLMKAKLLHQGQKIFRRKKRKQPRESIGLDDCLGRTFTNTNDPVRLNLEMIQDLRNAATHLIVPFVPPDIMGIFQAGVLNYSHHLQEWFGFSVSDRVPLGMMSLVYDFDPMKHSLENAKLQRKLPAETIRWLKEFQQNVRTKAQGIEDKAERFFIPLELKLALVKNPSKADIALSASVGSSEALTEALIVEVPKNPDQTHPHRQKDVAELINLSLGVNDKINAYDLNCVKVIYKIPSRAEFYYKSKFASPQYSQAYADWLKSRYAANANFFRETRQKRWQGKEAPG